MNETRSQRLQEAARLLDDLCGMVREGQPNCSGTYQLSVAMAMLFDELMRAGHPMPEIADSFISAAAICARQRFGLEPARDGELARHGSGGGERGLEPLGRDEVDRLGRGRLGDQDLAHAALRLCLTVR